MENSVAFFVSLYIVKTCAMCNFSNTYNETGLKACSYTNPKIIVKIVEILLAVQRAKLNIKDLLWPPTVD